MIYVKTIERTLLLLAFFVALSGIRSARAGSLDNSGFENGEDSWRWYVNGKAEAWGEVQKETKESGKAHGGESMFHIQNQSETTPDVYGALSREIDVKPQTKYSISVWYRAEGACAAALVVGKSWQTRAYFKEIDGDWREAIVEYTTGEKEESFPIIILTDGLTENLWIDDLSVEADE